MMSKFKYCPMCGSEREDDLQFCRNCNFEFLVGKYKKVDDEKSENEMKISVEKVSQDEFVESNDFLRESRDKINHCIAKHLNNELNNQYGDKYTEIIDIELSEYICTSLNNEFRDDFTEDYLESIETLLHDEKFISSKNIFIQWIGENRGHLPGMILNQYNIPIKVNLNNLNNIISLDLQKSDENEKFKDLINEYSDFENEFLDSLI